MSPVRLGPNDLLEYNASYGVTICRECKYAIQKSALKSHLLRHKIFRHGRHSLISSIFQLELHEPDDVPLPPPTSKPIHSLPVHSGFRCMIGACDSLYASSKRMRRHQLETHDVTDSDDLPESMVRSVYLQTFFRGTKIRYFEVAPQDSSGALNLVKRPNGSPGEILLPVDEPMRNAVEQLPPPQVLGIDLSNLQYFHHFLSNTSLTLPATDLTQFTELYWHHEFVAQALSQQWLMAGLLALSTSHKAVSAHQSSVASHHLNQSVKFCEQYEQGKKAHLERPLPGHIQEQVTPSSFNTSSRGLPTPRKEVLDQLSSVIKCAHALFLAKKTGASVSLEALIVSIRSLIAPGIAPRTSYSRQTSVRNDDNAFDRAAQTMAAPVNDPSLSRILSRVSSLPTRMAEVLGRPQDHEGLRPVIVALPAIATLIDKCVAGFESDEVALSAMVTWLSGAADEFHDMIARNDPAVLIVLAHWATSLVRRVEENGCWFLKGATEFMLARIGERLPVDQPAVRQLVEGL